jgi:hypothetical protein
MPIKCGTLFLLTHVVTKEPTRRFPTLSNSSFESLHSNACCDANKRRARSRIDNAVNSWIISPAQNSEIDALYHFLVAYIRLPSITTSHVATGRSLSLTHTHTQVEERWELSRHKATCHRSVRQKKIFKRGRPDGTAQGPISLELHATTINPFLWWE